MALFEFSSLDNVFRSRGVMLCDLGSKVFVCLKVLKVFISVSLKS